ncbi:MAG: polysaccharide deacetylase [Lachnospiraceae bacterium]|nr:polysaccharide deacetylase [Lachnospiraceae bacterium]
MKGTYDRKKEIRRARKVPMGAVAGTIVVPLLISVIFAVRVFALQDRTPQEPAVPAAVMQTDEGQESGIYTTVSVEVSSRDKGEGSLPGDGGQEASASDKIIYLTFDDGPSGNTNRILDILKEYNIKATFFVVGRTDENSVKAYQRIVSEGHTLGMHSYSHKYAEVYASEESFISDLEELQEYLYQVTGVWSRYYRFPGGSSNDVSRVDMQKLIAYLNENDITYFDWNIASGDAVSYLLSAETITRNCVSGIDRWPESMILMHDASEKNTTVEALPKIIEQIEGRGDAVFLPITDETIPIQHVTADQ